MKKRQFKVRGFTLIEVFFAFLILAAMVGGLLYMQTTALRRATQGALLITASELARKKMIDCKYDLLDLAKTGGFGFSDYKDDGDFSEEGHSDFTWSCEAPFLQIPLPNLEGLATKKPDAEGDTQDPLIALVGSLFGPLITALGESARELVTTVKYKRGKVEEEFKITTHVVIREQFARLVAAFPALPFPGGPATPPNPQLPQGGGPSQ
jgi:hypothetical protein